MEEFLKYAPLIVVIMVFLIQQRIVVTPEQLEKKHREILSDVEEHFASISSVKDLKDDVYEMKEKIDKIYEKIFEG